MLTHEAHSHAVEWDCDLSSLGKVLLFLGEIHRFAYISINLCNTIENTLEAILPTPPAYLDGAEMLVAVLDAKLAEKVQGTVTPNITDAVDANLSTAQF